MAMALVSLFLIGLGISITYWHSLSILGQIVEPKLSKKFISTLNGAFAIGGIVASLVYNNIKSWRLA